MQLQYLLHDAQKARESQKNNNTNPHCPKAQLVFTYPADTWTAEGGGGIGALGLLRFALPGLRPPDAALLQYIWNGRVRSDHSGTNLCGTHLEGYCSSTAFLSSTVRRMQRDGWKEPFPCKGNEYLSKLGTNEIYPKFLSWIQKHKLTFSDSNQILHNYFLVPVLVETFLEYYGLSWINWITVRLIDFRWHSTIVRSINGDQFLAHVDTSINGNSRAPFSLITLECMERCWSAWRVVTAQVPQSLLCVQWKLRATLGCFVCSLIALACRWRFV